MYSNTMKYKEKQNLKSVHDSFNTDNISFVVLVLKRNYSVKKLEMEANQKHSFEHLF